MAEEDYRFAITAEKYLDKHNVLVYIEDSISQLLEHKDENPKVNPTRFFSDYFNSVKEGNHTLFREYSYVKATLHNRASFVRTFWKCFRNIGRKGDLLSVKEYHSLVCLLCQDFPYQPIQKTARIILMEDAMDCLISFTDFLYTFQVQFCYDEFLTKCAEVYKTLQEAPPQSPRNTVVVPTSEITPQTVFKSENTNGALPEGVDSLLFYRALHPITEKLESDSPQLPILKEILSSAERVTFYGFLMAMSKSDALNESIGKLPNKAKLLDLSDQELTSEIPDFLPGLVVTQSRKKAELPPIRPLSATMKSKNSQNQSNPQLNENGDAPPVISQGQSKNSIPFTQRRKTKGRPRKTHIKKHVRTTETSSSEEDDSSSSSSN